MRYTKELSVAEAVLAEFEQRFGKTNYNLYQWLSTTFITKPKDYFSTEDEQMLASITDEESLELISLLEDIAFIYGDTIISCQPEAKACLIKLSESENLAVKHAAQSAMLERLQRMFKMGSHIDIDTVDVLLNIAQSENEDISYLALELLRKLEAKNFNRAHAYKIRTGETKDRLTELLSKVDKEKVPERIYNVLKEDVYYSVVLKSLTELIDDRLDELKKSKYYDAISAEVKAKINGTQARLTEAEYINVFLDLLPAKDYDLCDFILNVLEEISVISPDHPALLSEKAVLTMSNTSAFWVMEKSGLPGMDTIDRIISNILSTSQGLAFFCNEDVIRALVILHSDDKKRMIGSISTTNLGRILLSQTELTISMMLYEGSSNAISVGNIAVTRSGASFFCEGKWQIEIRKMLLDNAKKFALRSKYLKYFFSALANLTSVNAGALLYGTDEVRDLLCAAIKSEMPDVQIGVLRSIINIAALEAGANLFNSNDVREELRRVLFNLVALDNKIIQKYAISAIITLAYAELRSVVTNQEELKSELLNLITSNNPTVQVLAETVIADFFANIMPAKGLEIPNEMVGSDLSPLVQKAYQAYQAKDFNRAVAFSTLAIDDNAEDISAYSVRGNAHFAAGSYKLSVEDFAYIIKVQGDNANAFYNRGLAYSRLNEIELAIADFEHAKALYEAQKDIRQEKQAFNQIELLYQKLSQQCADAAYVEYKKGNHNQAISHYNQAINYNFANLQALKGRGHVYYKQAEYQKAIADFTKITELDDKQADIFYDLGLLHYKLEQDDLARQNFVKARDLYQEQNESEKLTEVEGWLKEFEHDAPSALNLTNQRLQPIIESASENDDKEEHRESRRTKKKPDARLRTRSRSVDVRSLGAEQASENSWVNDYLQGEDKSGESLVRTNSSGK